MRTKSFIILLIVWLGFGLSGWGQFLEIHHIGVGRGDCSFIVASDGTNMRTILLDAGEKRLGERLVWPYVLKQLVKLNYPRIDFIVTTHIHADHNSGFPSFFNALIDFNEKNPTNTVSVGFIIDRTVDVGAFYPSAPQTLLEEDCYSETVQNPVIKSSEKFGKFFNSYQKIVLENTSQLNSFKSGSQTVYSNISLKADLLSAVTGISMILLTGNGAVANTPQNQQIAQSGRAKENDLSFSFLLQFNSFNYFTGGDLGGAIHGGSGTNMETPLVQSKFVDSLLAPQGNICAFKVSHHGSQGSTNPDFLRVMKPSLAVIMANFRRYNGTPLPTADIVEKLFEAGLNPEKDIFVTYNTNPIPLIANFTWGTQSSDVNYWQDIILQVGAENNPPPPDMVEFKVTMNLKEKDGDFKILDTETLNFDCFDPE